MPISPFFSVVVPTRDRLHLLEQTLLGLKGQTFGDFEVIVVDDGSSEATRAGYAAMWEKLDARFQLVLLGPPSHPGSGPSRARNYGIAKARGRFLGFCDDDDRWCVDDHLTIAAKALAEVPEARMYVANQIGIRDGDLRVADWLPEVTSKLPQRRRLADCNVHVIRQADLIRSAAFPHLNILIVHRDIVTAIRGFWEKTSYEEDLNFFWRCLDRVDTILIRPDIVSIHNIPNPLAQDNVSTQASRQERWALRGLICRHVSNWVTTPELVFRSTRYQADTLRHFARELVEEERLYAALRLGIISLASRFSIKWAVYCAYLLLLAILQRGRSWFADNSSPHDSGSPQIAMAGTVGEPPGQSITPPFFSVVVPTRDRLHLLEQTLLGLKGQTFGDFEVIVVDDGSSAATRAGYAALWEKLDARFQLVLLGPPSHPGSGPSRARNYGIAKARGRFLGFCDDDDRWCADDHLTIAAKALAEVPEARMYIANQIGIHEGYLRVADWLPEVTSKLPQRRRLADCNVHVIRQADLIHSAAFPHLNILIVHRDIVTAIRGFWEKTSYEGDLDFFWRCLDRIDTILMRPDIVSIHNIPNHLARDNVSTQASQDERWLIRAMNCRHVLGVIRTSELIARVVALEGDTMRHLAVHLQLDGHHHAALCFALQALAGRFSLKWTGFVVALLWRTLIPDILSRMPWTFARMQ